MPVVSVIIPMYNAEKYIGECLDSILNQTFQDFEVIVVDDCSTDNSRAVVESYVKKFGGRLKLEKTLTNSGGGGYVPRNIGLKLSRGEYIQFVDADDFIAETALEILNAAATQSNADVVYASRYHLYESNGKFQTAFDGESAFIIEQGLGDKPTLTINNPNKNLQRLLFEGNFNNPWTKFVARNFLLKNKIEFPQIISGGDYVWTIQIYCCSKRFLRLPIPLYFYRNDSAESIWQKKRLPAEQIYHHVTAFLKWLKAFSELSNQIEILKQNPPYCFQALNLHFNECLRACEEERKQLSTQEIFKILCQDSSDLILPFFFSAIDAYRKELLAAQQHVAELEGKE